MNQNTHPTPVKTLAKVLYGTALLIFLASCSSGDSNRSTDKKTTPTLEAPSLVDVSAQTYTTRQEIAVLSFTNDGGNIQASGCTVKPALPIGLVLSNTTNNQTCQITGTPTKAVAANDYIITATNATGSGTTTVNITVSAPATIRNVELKSSGATSTPQNTDVLTLTFETAGTISFAPQVSIGGQPADVAAGNTAGQWTATLTVDANFATNNPQSFDIIIVVPNGASSTEDLSQGVTVTTVGTTKASLTLADVSAFTLTPILALKTTSYSFTKDQLIIPITFINEGGDVEAGGCNVNTPLPRGLSLAVSGTTCRITGTPGIESISGDYIITATNATGPNTITVNLTVTVPVSIDKVQLTSSGEPAPIKGDVLTLAFETTGQTNFDPQVRIGGQLADVIAGETAGQWTAILTVGANFKSDDQGFEVIVVVPKGASSTEDLSQGTTIAAVPATPDLDLEDTAAFLLAPSLALETTSYLFVRDQLIDPITFANGGGAVETDGCNVDTPLPRGLSLDVSGTTCEITGTPEVITGLSANVIAIIATNVVGEDRLTITIGVRLPLDDPNLSDTPLTETVTAGDTLSITVTNNGGGMLTGCFFIDSADNNSEQATLGGLTIAIATNQSDCVITGSLADLGQQIFTVRATNVANSDDARIVFTVNLPAPNFSRTPLTETVTIDTSFGPITITNNGGGMLTKCVFLDSADNNSEQTSLGGLTIAVADNDKDCEISGSLDELGSQTFTVRATNATGPDGATIEFTVTEAIPALTAPDTTYYAGQEGKVIVFGNTGGAPQIGTCVEAISSPAFLPASLDVRVSEDGSTCEIYGTPRTNSPQTTYVIEATNTGGTAIAEVKITVRRAEVATLVAPADEDLILVINQDISENPIVITNSATAAGSAIATCAFVGGLGDQIQLTTIGLSIGADTTNNTCNIAGTPRALGIYGFSVVATSVEDGLSETLDLSLTINPEAPNLPDAPLTETVTAGDTFPAITVVNDGGGMLTKCVFLDSDNSDSEQASLGSLRVAIATNQSDCVVMGSLSYSVGTQTFTVRATNATDSDDAMIVFTVNPEAPDLGTPSAETVTTGAELSITVANNGGGALTGCFFLDSADNNSEQATLGDLTIAIAVNKNDCVITGFLTDLGQQTFMVRATNITNSDEATITFTVNDVIPALTNAPDTTYYVGQEGKVIVFTNTNGGAPQAGKCVEAISSPAFLPDDLDVRVSDDGLTCEIFGTPKASSPQTTYIIEATNTGGTASAEVKITVRDAEVATLVAPAAEDLILVIDQDISENPIFITNSATAAGGAIATCAFVGTLGSQIPLATIGLSISADTTGNTCNITGAPSVLGVHRLPVRATSVEGGLSEILPLALTINPQAPNLSDAPLTAAVIIDTPFGPITVTNNGGGRLSGCFFIDSADNNSEQITLGGLSIRVATNDCVINGSLDELGSQTFTVLARNVTGSDQVEIEFTVNPPAPNLTSMAEATFFLDGTKQSFAFVNSDGGSPATCRLVTVGSLTLPGGGGLVLDVSEDGSTCEISGTPTGSSTTVTEHTVEARNASGPSSATITITVRARGEVFLTNPINRNPERMISEDLMDNPIVLLNANRDLGSEIATCEFVDGVSNPMPLTSQSVAGLRLQVNRQVNQNSCDIIGTTPATLGVHTVYVRATSVDDVPSNVFALTIEINDVAPRITLVESPPFTAFVNGALSASATTITFTPAGGAITACAATNLHAGLVISQTTCAITGTPTETGTRTIRVTASNSEARVMSNPVSFDLAINKQDDDLSFGEVENSAVKLSEDGTMASITYAANLSFTRLATSESATRAATYEISGSAGVATVASGTGVVTIVGVGTTEITATRVEGDNHNKATTSYTLDVAKGTGALSFGEVTNSAVTISGTTASVTYAANLAPTTFTRTATNANGSGTIAYTLSGDEDVATVASDTGVVTIVGIGEVTITATLNDDPNYSGTASYTLTVMPVIVNGAAPNGDTITLWWPVVLGADSYEVYRHTENSENGRTLLTGPIIDATTDPKYDDTSLTGDSYFYWIKACDDGGCSDFSAAVKVALALGTEASPHAVVTVAQLKAIGAPEPSASLTTRLAGHYRLERDIDLSDISNWTPIGDDIRNKFTGSFDGQGFEISGLNSSGHQYAGLFGWTKAANIRNIGVLVGNVSSSAPSPSYAGGLVGLVEGGLISNSYAKVTGNISSFSNNIDGSPSHAGGLLGRIYDGGVISNSYAEVTGDISATSSKSSATAGGLVGETGGSIRNSHAVVRGNISASGRSFSSYAGGLTGNTRFDSQVSNSYAIVTGNISTLFAAGGLVGYTSNSAVNNSYAVVTGEISVSASFSYVGGLVGDAFNSSVSNSYAVVRGAISATNSSSNSLAGGLVGNASGSSSVSNSYYSASRKAGEGEFSNTEGMSKTVAELKAPTDLSRSIYADWTAFYDADSMPDAHALITDTSVSFVDGTDRYVWYFGDAQQLPTLNPSPVAVSNVDLPLHRARQHFVATASSATQVNLSWSSVGDAYTSYEVYRHIADDTSGAAKIATPLVADGGAYTNAGLTTGTTYYYWLKACPADTTEMCSDFFAHTQVTTP